MNPNSSGPLGNTMSRLAGLKNVRPRRVMPGAEFLEELAPHPIDVEGTAQTLPNFENFRTRSPNEPENDTGGELTAQSYDVRANSAEPAENQDQLSRLGSALNDYQNVDRFNSLMPRNNAKPPQLVTSNAPTKGLDSGNYGQAIQGMQNPKNITLMNLPEVSPENMTQLESNPGLLDYVESASNALSQAGAYIASPLTDYLNPELPPPRTQEEEDAMVDMGLEAQGIDPIEFRQAEEARFYQEVEQANAMPWTYSAYGSAKTVADHPALQAEFEEITGMDYTPQIAEQTAIFEKAMKGVKDALEGNNTQLDAQSEPIKQRILTNSTTENDKFLIGMALLMPLLIGGIFGKEAGLGALGGTAKGYAEALGNREKNIRKDEETLLDIGKQKTSNLEKLANIGLQEAKLPGEIQKNLPPDKRAHLEGYREAPWIDPKTGKEQMGTEILPGLVAKSNFVKTEKGLDNKVKQAEELAKTKSYVQSLNDVTATCLEIVDQLEDKNIFQKYMTSILSGAAPGALGAVTQDVMFEGRMQNAGVLLEQQLGFLANLYGQAQEIGQLDRAAQAHIKKIIENPASTLLSPEQAKSQLLKVRELSQNGLIRDAENEGFVPEFLIRDMEENNNEVFGKLNEKHNRGRLENRKRQLY